MKHLFEESIYARKQLLETVECDAALQAEMEHAVNLIMHTFQNGGKLLFCGNGGSAADAEHIVAEFVGSFCGYTKGLCALALTANSAVMSALSNDFGFEIVFKKQIEAIATDKDLVIALSTSGESENILCALQAAKSIGAKTLLLCGENIPGVSSDGVIAVPSADTALIQEMHFF